MILPIYLDPHKMLRGKSETVAREQISSEEFQEFLDSMIETMAQAEGIGLAGAQIGKLWRVTVIDTDVMGGLSLEKFRKNKSNPERNTKGFPLINPVIKRKSFKKIVMEEGCLSIPGIYGLVKRPASMTVEFLNRDGKKSEIKADGLVARVLLHEIDHMDGVLFTDKVGKYTNTERVEPKYEHIE